MEEKEVDFEVLKSEINQEQRRILKISDDDDLTH